MTGCVGVASDPRGMNELNTRGSTFETLLCGSIFDKTSFCLGEKEGMLVNNECSAWYNRVGDC